MTEQNRFDDAEVAEILRQAVHGTATDEVAAPLQLPARSGLTLTQVQAIAGEVGISPEAVSRAAAAIERGDHLPAEQRLMMGLPVGIGRLITLPRIVADEEWERIVFLLQETFAARGRQYTQGDVREWRNGNLRALLEPDGDRHRLRLTTIRGDARLFMQMGAAMGGFGAAFMLLNALVLHDPAIWGSAGMLVGLGGIALLRNVLVLPKWARARSSQMESLGARIAALLARR